MAWNQLPQPAPFPAIPGYPPVPWHRCFQIFQTYLMAYGLDDKSVSDARRREILLHCLGTEGQRVFSSFAGAFVPAPLSHKYMIVVRDLHSNWSVVSCNSSVTSGTITNCSPGGDYQKLSPLTMDPDSHLLRSLNSCAVKGLDIALRLSTILKATVV